MRKDCGLGHHSPVQKVCAQILQTRPPAFLPADREVSGLLRGRQWVDQLHVHWTHVLLLSLHVDPNDQIHQSKDRLVLRTELLFQQACVQEDIVPHSFLYWGPVRPGHTVFWWLQTQT